MTAFVSKGLHEIQKLTISIGLYVNYFLTDKVRMEISMSVNFLPHKNHTDELIEVHLGPALHGYIIKTAPKKYHYFRLVNDRVVPRHEADNVDILKQMVLETP